MGYGPGKLELVLEYLPDGGSILDLGYQKFHGTQQNRGDVGAYFVDRNYWYACIDTQPSPYGDPFDLNEDCWEYEVVDVVTNFGTTEHVMDQVNAFRVVHDACRANGVMIHEVPHCRPEHGMFSYNLSFFRGLAKANDYETIRLETVRGAKSNGAQASHIVAIFRKSYSGAFRPALDYSTH